MSATSPHLKAPPTVVDAPIQSASLSAPAGVNWPVKAWRARSDRTSPAVRFSRQAQLLGVVLDTDSVVLHRGGHNNALAAADRLGYIEGAQWDLGHAGVNAAWLAQVLGKPATVNRFEHTFLDQHRLCCLAIPIRTPNSGHIILNLTTTTDALISLPPPSTASSTRLPNACTNSYGHPKERAPIRIEGYQRQSPDRQSPDRRLTRWALHVDDK